MKKINILLAFLTLAFTINLYAQQKDIKSILPGGDDKWQLVWNDEFDYSDKDLDKKWISQNGPSGHILSSRWRENAVVANGTLKLINKKEQKGGQEWTSGNIWTKEKFLYGYYECRYKYAAAPATNNSFWLMTQGGKPTEGKSFEIDINEGHFPNEVATNVHNWSDFYMEGNKKTHYSSSKSFTFGSKPDYTIQLEIPITTNKIRFVSNHPSHFNLGEFRIYNVNKAGYPNIFSETADKDVKGLVNFARDSTTEITVSGVLKPDQSSFRKENLTDGKIATRYTTQKDGEKWVEFEFNEKRTIGCLQFLNGWTNKGNWEGLISDYKVQYWNGKNWIDISSFDINNGQYNFAKEYHTLGLDWSKEELVFFLDGKEIRRVKNEFCYSPSPVWLSLAIIPWGGAITLALDGSFMEVDYVRIFKRE